MEKNEIIKIYGKKYRENTEKLLNIVNLEKDILKKCEEIFTKNSDSSCLGLEKEEVIKSYKSAIRIAIKPNLVSPTPASYGATTHVEVVEGIVTYLQEKGFSNITIMEGSWVGDKTELAFDVCGYNDLVKRTGVKLIDAQKDGYYEAEVNGLSLVVCNCTKDVDYMINVPVLKGHCQTKITCALKNMKGLVPNKEKRHFHTMGIHKPVGYLAKVLKQDFIVIDHICGDLDFEDGGNPVEKNCIMAAKDPVLVDAYVCKILNYKPEDVPYIKFAHELQVGEIDINKASIKCVEYKTGNDSCTLTENSILEDNVNINYTLKEENLEEYEERTKLLMVNDVVEEVYSCSSCYGSLIPALDRIREEGNFDKLKCIPRICIGQGYKGKKGKIGVGNCTKLFDFSVKGCPPSEDDIYNALMDKFIR